MIGRRPSIAAPTAKPTIASSLIGASITRPGNSFARFFVALNAPPKAPMSWPVDEHLGIVRQGLGLGFANRFEVSDAHSALARLIS